MNRRIFGILASACAFLFALSIASAPASAAPHLSRIFYIMMENQGFDDVIGHENTAYQLDTPFITTIAFKYGLETLSFGTTHPSLPNYLSLVGGSYYGIQDDNASCFAVPKQTPCDTAPGMNLVDLLEAKHLTWVDYQQSMPKVGYLGPQWPISATVTHYAQKHNPFLYYKDIVSNPARMMNVQPLNSMTTLAMTLANPKTAPNFVFIAPDECHDMHGTADCPSGDALLKEGDTYLNQLVTTITKSKAYTADSAIIIAWDENDYSSNIGCCGSLYPRGGGHMAVIVITPRYKNPIESAVPSNHYGELRTIEDVFGLPHLGMSATQPPTLLPLIP